MQHGVSYSLLTQYQLSSGDLCAYYVSVHQDLGYTVFSTVCAFYLPCVVMMVIYGKVFQAARARIHKKRFRNEQPKQQHHQQQQQQLLQEQEQKLKKHQEQLQEHQQQQQLDLDVSLDAGQLVSSASDCIVHPETPDDGGGNSIVSQSPSDRQVLGGTNVTLTVFTCDDDEEEELGVERTTPAVGPPVSYTHLTLPTKRIV